MMFVWHERQSKNTRIFNKEKAEQIIGQVQNGRLDIVKADKKRKKVYAPQLYDLTQLQRDANRLYNFSAKETLNYMQRLYEHYKVLTYPRTDSRYLTSDMTQTLTERVRACSAPEWSAACAQILKDKPKASPRFCQ